MGDDPDTPADDHHTPEDAPDAPVDDLTPLQMTLIPLPDEPRAFHYTVLPTLGYV